MLEKDIQKMMEYISKWTQESLSHNIGEISLDERNLLVIKDAVHDVVVASLKRKKKSKVLDKYRYRIFCPRCKKTEDVELYVTNPTDYHVFIDFGCDWAFSTELCKFIHTACMSCHPIHMLVGEYSQNA